MVTQKSDWIGNARLGRGWAAFKGAVGDNDVHGHHAIQCYAGDRVLLHEGKRALSSPGFVLPPNYKHRAASLEEAAFLYIDPDTRTGKSIAQRLGGSPRELASVEATRFRGIVEAALEAGDDANPIGAFANLLDCEVAARAAVDARVAQLIERVSASPDVPSAEASAASVGLSQSRLLHLFKDEVGVPWRSFLLWWKLRRAIEAVATGATLTEAAHAGGFADSAHFSRTCRAMFGINPNAMTRALAFRQ